MRTNARRLRGRERGSTVLLLVVVILAAMFAATLILSSTTAVTTSSMRYGEERARLNALTGLTLAGGKIETDVPQALLQAIHELNQRKDEVDMSLPQLSGITFPELEYAFDELPGEGNTSDDKATVRALVTLTGPPRQLSLAGQPRAGGGSHQDLYTFRVRMTVEAESVFGARSRARQEANVYVALLVREGHVTADEPRIASVSTWPASVRRLHESDPWAVVPAAYAAAPDYTITLMNTFIVPGSGASPAGAWSGPPEVVSGPTPVGQTNGNMLYYWYLKGLPPGTTARTTGATILTVDTWRQDTSYQRGNDTIEYRPAGGLPTRVKGTPLYAVVAVQAPTAHAASEQGGGFTLDQVILDLPDGSTLTLPLVDRSWVPNMADMNAPDGGRYRVVSDPGDLSATSVPVSLLVTTMSPPTNSTLWRLATDNTSTVGSGTATIRVTGSRENNGLWGGPFGPAGEVDLVSVRGERRRMRAVFQTVPGGAEFSSAFMENSYNDALEAGDPDPGGGGGGGPWDPPDPGDEPGAMAAVVMYVPLAPYFVPDTVRTRGPGR